MSDTEKKILEFLRNISLPYKRKSGGQTHVYPSPSLLKVKCYVQRNVWIVSSRMAGRHISSIDHRSAGCTESAAKTLILLLGDDLIDGR